MPESDSYTEGEQKLWDNYVGETIQSQWYPIHKPDQAQQRNSHKTNCRPAHTTALQMLKREELSRNLAMVRLIYSKQEKKTWLTHPRRAR